MMGRPTIKTPELLAELLDRLVTEDGGLEVVCEADDMPGNRTVYRWLREDDEFRQAYTHAREAAGDIQAFRAMKAAIGAVDPAKGRLEYDARKWAASKLNGKWYGDKTVLAGDPDNPIATSHKTTLDLTQLSTETLREIARLATPDHG